MSVGLTVYFCLLTNSRGPVQTQTLHQTSVPCEMAVSQVFLVRDLSHVEEEHERYPHTSTQLAQYLPCSLTSSDQTVGPVICGKLTLSLPADSQGDSSVAGEEQNFQTKNTFTGDLSTENGLGAESRNSTGCLEIGELYSILLVSFVVFAYFLFEDLLDTDMWGEVENEPEEAHHKSAVNVIEGFIELSKLSEKPLRQ